MGRLTGKVALVTGGARAMGAATVRLFAAEGAKVIIADVLEDEGRALAAEIGETALFVRLDVTDEANWRAATDEAVARFGPIDVLVNNAGILFFGAIVDIDLADFERVLRVNLVGTFLGLKTVGKAMLERGRGSIVNISSTDGMRGGNALGAYASSKWGVRGLTKVATLEFGHRGVRVNSVHPGGINTPMSNPMGAPSDQLGDGYTRVPLQRVGEPDEVARASLFLASDEASYINGTELLVDGGWMAGIYHEMLPGAPAR